jgi:cytoskeletal protein CcmA (bactofilin family)
MENITEIEALAIPRGGHRNGATGAKGVTLGPRDVLNGSLTIDGDLHIEGPAEGEISASGDVNVVAHARLTVAGSGVVLGDVRAARLRVDDGGTVNGTITMGASESE